MYVLGVIANTEAWAFSGELLCQHFENCSTFVRTPWTLVVPSQDVYICNTTQHNTQRHGHTLTRGVGFESTIPGF